MIDVGKPLLGYFLPHPLRRGLGPHTYLQSFELLVWSERSSLSFENHVHEITDNRVNFKVFNGVKIQKPGSITNIWSSVVNGIAERQVPNDTTQT